MNKPQTQLQEPSQVQSQNLPVYILLSYLIFGFCLYLIAPFDWRLQNTPFMVAYFIAIIFVFVVGFKWQPRLVTRISRPVPLKILILFGTLSSVAVLIPATQLYSGKYPWEFAELLANQAEAYTNYQERLSNSLQADRAPVAILRTIIYPFMFSVLPLTILNWATLSKTARLGAFVVVACMLITSLARGTDRESFDLLVFVGSSWLINYVRQKNASSTMMLRPMSKTRIAVLAVMFSCLMVFFLYVFIERKLGRFGGNATALCIGSEVDICLTHAAVVADYLSDWQVFAIGITASYMSQGYYGLSTAMGFDFQSTFFTGFSPLIARFYEAISGDSALYMSSYTYRLRALGWSDEYTWSTLMIWFANDVGFLGALFVLFLLSVLFGAAWRDAIIAKDDRAAIVFVMLFLMFIYLPANNQIGQTLDLSVAFLFWLFRWRYMKAGPRQNLTKLNFNRHGVNSHLSAG